jgi:hypothetical protein
MEPFYRPAQYARLMNLKETDDEKKYFLFIS